MTNLWSDGTLQNANRAIFAVTRSSYKFDIRVSVSGVFLGKEGRFTHSDAPNRADVEEAVAYLEFE